MPDAPRFRVIAERGRWLVERDGGRGILGIHRDRSEAVRHAAGLARTQAGRVWVGGPDGRFSGEIVYEPVPAREPGPAAGSAGSTRRP